MRRSDLQAVLTACPDVEAVALVALDDGVTVRLPVHGVGFDPTTGSVVLRTEALRGLIAAVDDDALRGEHVVVTRPHTGFAVGAGATRRFVSTMDAQSSPAGRDSRPVRPGAVRVAPPAVPIPGVAPRHVQALQLVRGDLIDPQPNPAGSGRWLRVAAVAVCPIDAHSTTCTMITVDGDSGRAHLHRRAEAMLWTRQGSGVRS